MDNYKVKFIGFCEKNNIEQREDILSSFELKDEKELFDSLNQYRGSVEVDYILEKIAEKLIVDSIAKIERSGIKLGLHRMENMLELFGNPQDNLKVIHIAGTNGKGSVSSYLKTVLSQKYKVAMYTSPSMLTFNDRIRINEDFISFYEMYLSYKDINRKWQENFADTDDKISVFEILTLIGILHFAKEKPDFLIMEVGLGGRFDATNVFKNKLLSIITKIGLDHTNLLGDTLEKIAYEKAGIIQENDKVLIYPQDEEALKSIRKEVNIKNSSLDILDEKDIQIKEINLKNTVFSYKDYQDIDIKMLGEHQVYNASLALLALDNLRERKIVDLSKEEIITGLGQTTWLGRLEWIKDNVLIDGAHNIDGVRSLVKYMSNYKGKKLKILVGILADKDFKDMINLFESLDADFYVTRVPINMKEASLDNLVDSFTKEVEVFDNYEVALDKIMPELKEDEIFLISGSLYLISEVRKTILKKY